MSPEVFIVIIVIVAVLLVVTIIWGIRAHRQRVFAGREDLIGKTAEVMTAMEPKGTVFVQGEHWAAISEAGRIEPGEEVTITKINGLKLWVTKK